MKSYESNEEEHLKLFLDNLILFFNKAVNNMVSLVLVGGLARGDVNLKLTNQGSFSLPNDIDIYIITKEKNNPHEFSKIKQKILKQLKQTSVKKIKPTLDLHFISVKELSKCPPTLRFYDLKYASKVIYGPDLREKIPSFDLPLYEGTRLLLNRLRYSLDWLSFNNFDKINEEKLKSEIAKNYYIACQAFTILKGNYEPFPEKAVKNISSLLNKDFPNFKDSLMLEKKSKLFFNLRKGNDIKIKNFKQEWINSLEILLSVIRFYHKEFIGVKNWDLFEKKISKVYLRPYIAFKLKSSNKLLVKLFTFFAQKMLTLRWALRLRKKGKNCFKFSKDPVLLMYKSTFLALHCFLSMNNLNKLYFKKAVNSLKKVYPFDLLDLNKKTFDHFLKISKEAYNSYFGIGETLEGNEFNVAFTVVN